MDAIAIHRTAGLVLMDDGALIPILIYMDRDGDECEPEDGLSCVAGPHKGKWLAIDMTQYSEALH